MRSRIASVLVGAMLLSGVVATFWGLFHMTWGKEYHHLPFICAAFLLIWFSSQMCRTPPLLIGTFSVGLIALATGMLWPLLVTLWIILASTILGQWLSDKLRIASSDWGTHFLVGAGVYGTAVGLIAHFPINYPGLYGTALALPILLGRESLQQWFVTVRQLVVQSYPPADRASHLLDMAIATVVLVLFVTALMPELGHDALAMHLFVPAHLATRQQWGFDASTYVWAVMPMLGDWIFSLGYMLAGETAARLINIGFIILLGWLIRDLVLWAGGGLIGARWAILIFLSTPLTFTESCSLFIESIWASFVVAGLLSVLKACSTEQRQGNQLLVAGILLGFALAAKAITLTVLPVLLLGLIWRHKMWLKPGRVMAIGMGSGLFVMVGCVPYVTAWWLTGNPVFPFFNKIFQSPLWPSVNFEAPAVFGKGLTWDFIYQVTFQSDRYLEAKVGAGGFQWLLLLLPLSAVLTFERNWRGISLILFAILSTALVFHSTAYLRYIFPAYVVMTAAIGVGLSMFFGHGTLQSGLMNGIAALAVALNLIFLLKGGWIYTDFPLKSIPSGEHRERYLAGCLPIRNAVTVVNALNTGRTPVAVLAPPKTAGLKSDALYADWYNYRWQQMFNAAKNEQDLVNLLVEKGVIFLIVDSSRQLTEEQRATLEHISSEIYRLGSISVRQLKEDYLFKRELLTNSDLSDIQGWTLSGDAVYDANAKTVVTSVSSPAVQTVAVKGGWRYLNTVVVRCHKEKTQGRIQVNWQDANGHSVRSDIMVYDCEQEWQEFTMKVTAPPNATGAAVYAAGHTASPIDFKSVSFKQ